MRWEELLLLLLPVITIVAIDVWDLLTTIAGGVYCGGHELNPAAREMVKSGKIHNMIYAKGIHSTLTILIYLLALTTLSIGYQTDNKILVNCGRALLLVFTVVYLVGIVVISLNISSLYSIAREVCPRYP